MSYLEANPEFLKDLGLKELSALQQDYGKNWKCMICGADMNERGTMHLTKRQLVGEQKGHWLWCSTEGEKGRHQSTHIGSTEFRKDLQNANYHGKNAYWWENKKERKAMEESE